MLALTYPKSLSTFGIFNKFLINAEERTYCLMNDERSAFSSRSEKRDENDNDNAIPQILKLNKGKKGRPIAILEVKPHDNMRISLGMFSKNMPPHGFMLGVEPDPDPDNSLVSNIVNLTKERSEQYELMLFLENYGIRTVSVEIWEI